MVSYADFVTLLFAFFVVMYSVSSLNEGKYRVAAESITAAFAHRTEVTKTPNTSLILPPERLSSKDTGKRIQKVRGVDVKVQWLDTGTILTIGGSCPFDTGEFVLKADHKKVLDEIREEMRGKRNVVEVRGYTSGFREDSLVSESGGLRGFKETDPLTSADHWLLSYMRAKAVADYLMGLPEPHVEAAQIKVIALAYNDPEVREQNPKDEEHAKENRRVEVKITNETAMY